LVLQGKDDVIIVQIHETMNGRRHPRCNALWSLLRLLLLLWQLLSVATSSDDAAAVVESSSSCCLCEDCIAPAEGLTSVDFVVGEVGCDDLHERLLLLNDDHQQQRQCNIHVRAHRDNCCQRSDRHGHNSSRMEQEDRGSDPATTAESSSSSKSGLRTLQYGNNHPKCELCDNGNVPGSCGRAIGTYALRTAPAKKRKTLRLSSSRTTSNA
jgi:hypothetical protein